MDAATLEVLAPGLDSGAPLAARLYRYGFCLLDRGALRPAQRAAMRRRGWPARRIGQYALWLHPETTLRMAFTGSATWIFLGDVVPEAADDLSEERLRALSLDDDAVLYDFIDRLAGRFTLLLLQGDRVRAFHDPMGSRSVFYHDQRPFALASHSQLLANCLGADRCPEMALYCAHPDFPKRRTQSLPGDRTLYQHIHALVPNNLFDSATMDTRRYWPRKPRVDSTLAEFQDRLDTAMQALGGHARDHHVPIFGLTGGVDTRLAIAAMRSFGVPFETVTWGRDSMSKREADIIQRLVPVLDVPHRYAEPAPGQHEANRLVHLNGGGLRKQRGSVAGVWKALGDRPDAIFLRGLGGEVIRGFYNLYSNAMTELTPAEMARMYFAARGDQPPDGTVAIFEDYFRRGNYEGLEAFGYDPSDIFYWEHRMGMWAATVYNEFDLVMRSMPAFNSRPLFAAAQGLRAETRLNKRLLLDATARYDAVLAGIPLEKMGATPFATSSAKTKQGKAKRVKTQPSGAKAKPKGMPTRIRKLLRRIVGRLRGLVRGQKQTGA